jgi:hypothetical protein
MNIRSVNTGVVSQPPQTITPKTQNTVASAAAGDTFRSAQTEEMVNILQQQPDVRPEAVKRAKMLAADPNYPSADTIAGLAKLVINSVDKE